MASLPSGARAVVLAGPGVAVAVPRGVDGLRALAHQAGLGVLNTWGLIGEAGLAAWNALHAAPPDRVAIAVTRDPYDLDAGEALADAATSGVAFVLCVWGARSLSSGDDHRERLAEALSSRRVRVVEVPVDRADTDLLVDLAGAIIAWT